MKVITIKQPFATLIAEGLKEYEFRTWKTKYRGPIYIHAGKGIDKEAMKRYQDLNLQYPTSKIIAVANITDCVPIDNKMRDILKNQNELVYYGVIHNKEWKGYGFKLEQMQKLEKPIQINGKLGLWNMEKNDVNETINLSR